MTLADLIAGRESPPKQPDVPKEVFIITKTDSYKQKSDGEIPEDLRNMREAELLFKKYYSEF